jgi:hypothetical protein
MSDQNPSTNKLQPQTNEKAADAVGASSTKRDGEGEKKKLPQLGALEDDDEFEVCFLLCCGLVDVMLMNRIFQLLVCFLVLVTGLS